MANVLEPREFTEANLAEVKDFYCGDQEWESAMADWIRNSAIASMAKYGSKVWLYYADGNELVGFGSLGESRWGRKAEQFRLAIIPALAIQFQFRRKPDADKQNRYSHQIMRDLIERALPLGHQMLGLFVHPKNIGAINLYRDFNFTLIERGANGYDKMARRIF